MKRSLPAYPIFIIELPSEGTNCAAYWVASEFGEIEFLGTIQYMDILKDEALENLLELSVDEQLQVYVGHCVAEGGTYLGQIYKVGNNYWHHVFAAEKRKTITAAARALYKKVRLHRTSIGTGLVAKLQAKRNF